LKSLEGELVDFKSRLGDGVPAMIEFVVHASPVFVQRELDGGCGIGEPAGK
jgi:hypothetical protein